MLTSVLLESSESTSGVTSPLVALDSWVPVGNATTPLPLNVTNSTAPSQGGILSQRTFFGMMLAIGGCLLISISLSVQKKVHNRLGQESETKYCVDKWWWLGMILMALGETGNFLAYGFAPASLVAPLGSVTVITNTVIAAIFLHEPLTLPSMLGVTLVVVGAIILISFSMRSRPILTSSKILGYLGAWPFLFYVGLEATILAVLLYLKYVKGKEHMIILLLLVAVIGSITVITAKALSTSLSEIIFFGQQNFRNPVLWVCLCILPITTISQIRFLNRAMQLYDVSNVVPVNFMFFTVSAILAGAVFYQEFRGVGFERIFMFIFGCLQSFVGVYIITKQEEDKRKTAIDEPNNTGLELNTNLHSGNSNNNQQATNNSSASAEDLVDSKATLRDKTFACEKTHSGAKESRCSKHISESSSLQSRTELIKDFLKSLKGTEHTSIVQLPSEILQECRTT